MSVSDNLCEVFDMEHDTDECINAVNMSTEKIDKIKQNIQKQKYNLEDKEYIRYELQSLIDVNRKVLDTLGEQCKMGAPPRLYEVFSGLSSTISNNLMELAKLNKIVTDYSVREADEQFKRENTDMKRMLINKKVSSSKGGTTLIQNNNSFNFSSTDLLNMMREVMPEREVKTLDELPKFNLE